MQTKPILFLAVGLGCAVASPASTPSDGAADETHDAEALLDATLSDATHPVDAGTLADGGGVPAGWLYTKGATIYVSDGTSGTPWVGRGVNIDDLFLCGYDNTLWMTNAESTLTTLVSKLLSDWKPTFIRVSLGMQSYPTSASWTSGDAAAYKTPMTNVIDAIGAQPNTYVLVTLRSDATMTSYLNSESTYVPTTATDAVYTALVDTFATSSFVLFGVSNEPGGNALSDTAIRDAMSHAVSTIRAEEDKLGVPHHLVSVQGNDWTSNISAYAANPLPFDNVIYEVHGYPPPASSYTYANIPVIVGEYGSLSDASAFYADLEAKGISNVAWDFDSFSNCAPDLLTVNQSATNLVPTTWGATVKTYLLAH